VLPDLTPGDELPRRELHARYGGRIQGGISPSSSTKAVMFFVSSDSQASLDGWDADGLYHYVGEGGHGDQRLAQGNKSILYHHGDGRTLEGFKVTNSLATYLGEFEYVDHYFTDAPDVDDVLRQVVVFKLRPMTRVPVDLPNLTISPMPQPRVGTVADLLLPIAHSTYRLEPRRLEGELVGRYAAHLRRAGHDVGRLWDKTTNELIEAKPTVTRSAIRLAAGQLLDYGRVVEPRGLALLVPSRPRDDLVAFLRHVGINVIYPDGNDWIRLGSAGGDATPH
jgi:hypothetical protein